MIDLSLVAGLGLILGQLAPLALGPVALCAAGLIALTHDRLSLGKVALALSLFGFGMLRTQGSIQSFESARAIARDALGAPEICGGSIQVTSSPHKRQDRYCFLAEAVSLDCEGNAQVPAGTSLRLYAQKNDLARGDTLDAIVRLGAIEVPRNFEVEGGLAYAARLGATLSGGMLDGERIGRDPYRIGGWIDRARSHARTRIEASYPQDAAPMARALVLGENDLSENDIKAFRTSGLSHLLAVSGTHVVLAVLGIVKVLEAILRRLVALSACIDVGRVAAGVGIPLAWIYAEFAGSGGSVRRAACMTTVALAARAMGRNPDGMRAFGMSLLAGALLDPLAAYDVSFGLSAGATAGLILASRPIEHRLEKLPRPFRWAAAPVAATIAASAFCLPWLTLLSPTFSVVGVFANVVAVPVGELVSLPACLLHLLLSPAPMVERGMALLGSGSLLVVRAIARFGADIEALSFATPRPTTWQLCSCALTAAAVLAFPKKRLVAIACGIAAWMLFEVVVIHVQQPRDKLRVTVLDVGQGDSILVDFPNGQAMLIDGGGVVGSPVDPGKRVLIPVLRARRRAGLSTVVLSHPHPDHFIGLASVVPTIGLQQMWDTGQGERHGAGPTYDRLITGLRERGVPILRPGDLCGQKWSFGQATVRVLGPCPDIDDHRHANDNSLILHIRLGHRSALLVGDAERPQEADLLELDPDLLKADLLKVGHHGSRTSSSPAFLDAVNPTHAIIPCGVRNRYGHPSPQTLHALKQRGIEAYRSDRHGAVIWETDGDSVSIRSVVANHR